jgi:hypothetical protein
LLSLLLLVKLVYPSHPKKAALNTAPAVIIILPNDIPPTIFLFVFNC